MVRQVLASQKKYGEDLSPESIDGKVDMFIRILGDLPLDLVVWSFEEYVKTKDDIPAPANIRKTVLGCGEYFKRTHTLSEASIKRSAIMNPPKEKEYEIDKEAWQEVVKAFDFKPKKKTLSIEEQMIEFKKMNPDMTDTEIEELEQELKEKEDEF